MSLFGIRHFGTVNFHGCFHQGAIAKNGLTFNDTTGINKY